MRVNAEDSQAHDLSGADARAARLAFGQLPPDERRIAVRHEVRVRAPA
jgi:hypothetical protein